MRGPLLRALFGSSLAHSVPHRGSGLLSYTQACAEGWAAVIRRVCRDGGGCVAVITDACAVAALLCRALDLEPTRIPAFRFEKAAQAEDWGILPLQQDLLIPHPFSPSNHPHPLLVFADMQDPPRQHHAARVPWEARGDRALCTLHQQHRAPALAKAAASKL